MELSHSILQQTTHSVLFAEYVILRELTQLTLHIDPAHSSDPSEKSDPGHIVHLVHAPTLLFAICHSRFSFTRNSAAPFSPSHFPAFPPQPASSRHLPICKTPQLGYSKNG